MWAKKGCEVYHSQRDVWPQVHGIDCEGGKQEHRISQRSCTDIIVIATKITMRIALAQFSA